MLKEDIICAVKKEIRIVPTGVIEMVLNSVLSNIESALIRGERVQFTGFGTFELKKRAPRTGRNPHTGEAVPIPARIIPSLKPGKILMKNVCKTLEGKK